MEEYSQEAVDAFAQAGRPIPGQSLTSNPDEPRPFEGPPDFTNFKEALDYTAAELLLEENFIPMVLAMGDGIPVTDLAMQIGYVGFREGKWNPDLMTMLMEPTMYMIMALAEKADIDFDLEAGDRDRPSEMSGDKSLETLQNGINELDKIKQVAISRVNPQSVPQEVREVIEETKLSPSLLQKVEEETQSKNLLSREE